MTQTLRQTASPSHLVRNVCRAWRTGGCPDARAAVEQYPHLEDDLSAFVDLAYEEFCQRRERGEAVDVTAFCQRFPRIEAQLHLVLAADGFLAEQRSLGVRSHSGLAGVEAKPGVSWPVPGETLGGRLLLRELGRGAFARVYLALEATAGDRPVAVKVSREQSFGDSGEARALGRLHHPHVMPILSAGVDRDTGLHLVCMPFLGGVTLADVIDRLYPNSGEANPPRRAVALVEAIRQATRTEDPEPVVRLEGLALEGLSFSEGVARLGETLARTLAFLHDRGLFHCDLKPSNLLLTALACPVLLDFNLARHAGQTGGLIGGTLAYVAPEQIRAILTGVALSAEEAPRADLFSLGVVLFELLTGRHPFGTPPDHLRAREEMAAWYLDRLAVRPDPGPGVPRRLAGVVERLLAFDPADRPASAAEVATWLKPRWRLGRLVGLTVLVVAGVIGVGMMVPGGGSEARLPTPREEMAQHRRQGREALERALRYRRTGPPGLAEAELRTAARWYGKVLDAQQGQAEPEGRAWEDHFAQGRTLLLLGELVSARTYLDRADELWHRDAARLAGDRDALAAIRASRSYCWGQLGDHRLALSLGRSALKEGHRSAALLNNLGMSALRLGESGEAVGYLNEALRRAPDCVPALFNRCQLPLRRKPSGGAKQPAVPAWALADVDRAIQLARTQPGMENAELYRLGAQLHALAALEAQSAGQANREGLAVRKTRDYLVAACEQGLQAEPQLHDPYFRAALGAWLTREQFEGRQVRPAVPSQSAYLLDPLR